MTFPFGASSRDPHTDRDLAEANRRTRRAMARDINDERALAFDDRLPTRPRRRLRWPVIATAVFLLLGGLGLLPRLGGLRLEVNCEKPSFVLSSYVVRPGDAVTWRATGPDNADYVLALDSTSIADDAGALRPTPGGSLLTAVFRMRACQIENVALTAPRDAGDHIVRLFQRSGPGFVQVDVKPLSVRI